MSNERFYKHYYVYMIINLQNNKIYVGCHRTDDLNDGYMGSGRRLWNSIRKYLNESAFNKLSDKYKKIILHEADNLKDMMDIEAAIVDKDFVLREDTYNMSLGGSGGNCHAQTTWKEPKKGWTRSEASKLRNKIASTGRKHPHCEEAKRKISENNAKNMLGKNHSEEVKKKISEKNKGRKLTDEQKKKISENSKIMWDRLGRKPIPIPKIKVAHRHTEEAKRKISEAHKGKKGHPMSAENRQKIREAQLQKKMSRTPEEIFLKIQEKKAKQHKRSKERRKKQKQINKENR